MRASWKRQLFQAFLPLALSACSKLSGSSGTDGETYRFPGVAAVRPVGDGTFAVSWNAAPAKDASYKVFRKEGTPSDPKGSTVAYTFNSPTFQTEKTSFVTEVVQLNYNVCFVVRLTVKNYSDTNTNEICTNHERYLFAGLESITPSGAESELRWKPLPVKDVVYRIFLKAESGYDFSAPFKAVTDFSTTVPSPSLGARACYIVRYAKDGLPEDTNSTELCTGETGLGSFSGIESAQSLSTGSVTITWNLGSGIQSYRIYEGADFTKSVMSIDSSTSTYTINGLLPESMYTFGVRALDSNGREDKNTKTLSVRVANHAAPTFTGVASLAKTGPRAFKATWSQASPVPKKYNIYLTHRNALHTDASINCDQSTNTTTCRDLIDWNHVYASVDGKETEYLFSGMGDDETYFVAARAVSASEVEERNIVVRSLVLPDDGAPTFLGISDLTISGGKAKLVWNPPIGQTSWYRIISTRNGQSTSTETVAMESDGVTPVLQYTTGTLASNTPYTFRVQAIDRYAAVDSNSQTLSLTTGDTQPPGAASAVIATPSQESAMVLTFNTPSDTDVSRYVFRTEKCLSGSNFYSQAPTCTLWGSKTIATAMLSGTPTPSSAFSATINSLESRSLYRFYIQAVDTASNSGPEVSVTKATLDLTPPQFSGVTSVVQNPDIPAEVLVTWDSPGGDVARYIVYVAQMQGANCFPSQILSGGNATPPTPAIERFFVTNPSVTRFSFAGAEVLGQKWCFTVRAVDDHDNEDTNTIVRSYEVPDLTPPAFNSAAVTAAWSSSDDGILINWQPAVGAAQYKIEVQCINALNCSNDNLGTCDYPAQTSAPTWGGTSSGWTQLALLSSSATSYKLPRAGGSGTCAGGENRKYRFKMTARTSTSDWQINSSIKPDINGSLIPDLSKPTWPASPTVETDQISDVSGSEIISISWPKATDFFTNPSRSGSGVSGYDIYLVRSSVPARVLIKTNISGTWNASLQRFTDNLSAADLVSACNAPRTDPTATPTAPISDGSCRFSVGNSYTFAVRGRDTAGNVHASWEEIQSMPRALTDVTPPIVTGVTLSATSLSVDGSTALHFTSNESGTFRVLECVSGDCTQSSHFIAIELSPGVTQGSMQGDVQVATGISGTALSASLGDKVLYLETRDGLLNSTRQRLGTAPAPSLTIIAPALSSPTLSPGNINGDTSSVNVGFVPTLNGSYRILECLSSCSGTPSYATLTSGTTLASVPVSTSFSTGSLSAGSGAKHIVFEVRDAANHAVTYSESTTPAVPGLNLAAPAVSSSISVSPMVVNDGTSFTVTFTPTRNGTYRIMECVANCATVPTHVNLATGSTTPGNQVSQSIPATSLSAGTGNKILALEVKDALNNEVTYSSTTTPSIANVYRNARPASNVSNFSILKYNIGNTPTFRLSWTLPAAIAGTDTIIIRKGTSTLPATCTDGVLLATKASTDTFHEIAVGSDTVDNVSFAAFVQTSVGLCSDSGNDSNSTRSRALWSLVTNVTATHSDSASTYSLSTNQNGAQARLAESRTFVKISAWRGTNGNSDTAVCGSPTICSSSYASSNYFSETPKNLATASTPVNHTFDYSSAADHPIWGRRYHRIYLENATGSNAELMSVEVWARTPPGMVYIPAESWPNGISVSGASPGFVESYPTTASFGDWEQVPHSFAIDKYEGSTAGNTSGSPESFPNTWAAAIVTANTAPAQGLSWFQFKQGCLNRTYLIDSNNYGNFASFAELTSPNHQSQATSNPRRKYHLATDMEWMIAAYNTPDSAGQNNCNSDSRGTPASPAETGTNSNSSCSSRFGARNMIGNLMEWTDSWAKNGVRGAWEKSSGTLLEQSQLAVLLSNVADGNTGSWSTRAQSRINLGTATSINQDSFSRPQEDGGAVEGGLGGGVGWTNLRGGAWNSGTGAGRFTEMQLASPLYSDTQVGGRCAIAAPQAAPTLGRFGSESNASGARLFWLFFDTEDSSMISLGYAATQAELDLWNGTNSPSGVSVESHAPGAVFSGSCTSAYTPTTTGRYSNKYCDSFSGTRYFKVCATNPVIAQVTDEFSALQRTRCSSAIAVSTALPLPALTSLANTMKLQNDSDGSFARFYWAESSGSQVTRRLIMGISKSEVEQWQGDEPAFNGFDPGQIVSGKYVGSLAGLRVLSGAALTADCVTADYNVASTTYGAWTPHAWTGFTQYACVNLSQYPKWSKFWFKVAIANTDGNGNIASGWTFSDLHAAGNVPNGMVMVAREEWRENGDPGLISWPNCVGASGDWPQVNMAAHFMPGISGYALGGAGCVYDFAVDKYEDYVAGTLSQGAFSTSTAFTGNNTTGILRSGKAQTAANSDWFAFKVGCDNRTSELISSGFVASAPPVLTRVRMPTGVEWVAAATNTPDDGNTHNTCWVKIDNGNTYQIGAGPNAGDAAFVGTGGMPKCISRFGVYDAVGNEWEWTDEVTQQGIRSDSSKWNRFWGTTQVAAFPATATFGAVSNEVLTGTSGSTVTGWDYVTAFVTAVGTGGTSNYWPPGVVTVGPPEGGYGGANWAANRGGSMGNGQNGGRFAMQLSRSPLYSAYPFGGRCTLLP